MQGTCVGFATIAGEVNRVGAERRRCQRFEIRLPGEIGADTARAVECEVRDYCSGGMLVLLAGQTGTDAGFTVGQTVRLSIRLQTPAGQRSLTIPAGVAWVRGDHLGIAFGRPSQALVDTLHHHERLSRQGGAVATSLGDAHSEGRCLAKIRHVAQGALPSMLRELLVETLDGLLETAERVTSDADRQQVYGDLNALERLRSGDLLIREVMGKALNPVHDEVAEKTDDAELSLVDTDEFERWLEASRAATQLERKFSAQLAAIGSRLTAMRQPESPDALAIPFEPKNFTDALKSVAEQLELGMVTRGVLFDRCIQVMQHNLGRFYQEIERALDAVGAPPASSGAGVRVVRQRPQNAANGASAEPPGDETTPAPGHVGEAAGSVAVASGNMVAVDARALEMLVTRDREMRETQAREMLDHLSTVVDGGQGMQNWLQMIDGPLIAEAVANPTFFQSADHPLHSIVDALGQLQLFRATPETSPEADDLRRQVDALLAPLVEGNADPDTLRSIAAEVSDLTREHSEQYQRNVERVVEASEGRDRVRRARAAVAKEVERRYAGRPVPAVVPELIEVGWRAVLELAWLNSPTRPQAFPQQLALLDAVVAYLGGEAFEEGVSRPDRSELAARISKELETTAIDPFRRTAVETRLRDELLGPAANEVRLLEMPMLDVDDTAGGDIDRPEEIAESAWKEVLATCATIRLGDRIQFVDAGGGERVLRVAWIREDRELYTLVDHRGVRVGDLGLTELAIGLHQRSIRIEPVDGRPLSGRAVDQMLDAMESRLSHLAAHDSLTGLMNRRQFHGALEKALKTPRAANKLGALLWIDIDQFKLINDIHGYATGDRLLVAVSTLVERQAAGEVVSHIGADRFAVLLSKSSLDEAEAWARELCDAARKMRFDWKGPSTALTVSAGAVALAGDSVGELMQAAENALAAAKTAGGDQLFVYRDDDPDISRQRDTVKWVARVDEALVDGELRLRCQPIVPVRPGEGIAPHYEVLLGVADASRESLPIAEFIEAAERYKRMRAVDRWVTKSVFDWIATHRDEMPQLHGFAVNLSGQTASDPAFVEFVRQQFRRTAIKPDWISFEVTETAAVASLSGTAGIIHELKKLGCKVALDDFGSGLASYSYLKELPVDWLKIDGVFVRDIVNDREDYAVVKSINDIGHFLGKQTIAEYVKDQPTLGLVREIGVDFAQGFGISPPLLLDDLLPHLAEQTVAQSGGDIAGRVTG